MTKYYIVTSGGYFALAVYQYSEAPSTAALLQLLPFLIVFLLRILVFLLRDRFTNQLGWFFLAVAIFQVGHSVLGTPIGSNQGGDEELDEEQVQSNLKIQFNMLGRIMAPNCFVAAASTMFCHAYVLTYILGVICLILIKGDLSNPVFITNLIELPLYTFAFYLGFYVLQQRELLRFNQEQRALKKEAQLTRVFNSISDAILVVQEKQGKSDNHADSDEEIIKDPKCLFVNSKSLEILGNDLLETIKKSNGLSVAPKSVSLNLKQFEITPSPF